MNTPADEEIARLKRDCDRWANDYAELGVVVQTMARNEQKQAEEIARLKDDKLGLEGAYSQCTHANSDLRKEIARLHARIIELWSLAANGR